MYIVYKHTNSITGKSYIGITSKSMENRWKRHVILANSKQCRVTHTAFAQAIKKYGASDDVWSHDIIHTCDSKDEACMYEKQMIKDHNTLSPNGYNITLGGEGRFGPMSDDAKKKIIEYCRSEKGRKRNREAQIQRYTNNPSLRLFRAELTRDIMSRDGMKEKISKAVQKSMNSNEVKENIRLANSDSDTKKRKSNSAKNAWQSEKTRAKHQIALENRIRNGALNNRPVHQISAETSAIIATFVSASQAARETGVHKSSILKCLKGRGRHAGGYIWLYADSTQQFS